MKNRFLCFFTRDDLELIIFSLQEEAQRLLNGARDMLTGPDLIKAQIHIAQAQKLQALAAVINRAVDNSEE